MEKAINKLESWCKDGDAYVRVIAKAIIERIKQSPALAEDVIKNNGTAKDMMAYIKSKAKPRAVGGCAMVDDETVFEWAEDFFRGKVSKRQAKAEADDDDQEVVVEEVTEEMPKKEVKPKKESKPKEEKKPAAKKEKKKKEESADFEQLSLFDFM